MIMSFEANFNDEECVTIIWPQGFREWRFDEVIVRLDDDEGVTIIWVDTRRTIHMCWMFRWA